MKNITYFIEISGGESKGSRYIGFTRDWLCERDSIYREFYKNCRNIDFKADGIDDGLIWISLVVNLGNDAKRAFTVYFGKFDELGDTSNEEELRIESDLEQGDFRKIQLKCTRMKTGRE